MLEPPRIPSSSNALMEHLLHLLRTVASSSKISINRSRDTVRRLCSMTRENHRAAARRLQREQLCGAMCGISTTSWSRASGSGWRGCARPGERLEPVGNLGKVFFPCLLRHARYMSVSCVSPATEASGWPCAPDRKIRSRSPHASRYSRCPCGAGLALRGRRQRQHVVLPSTSALAAK